MMKNISILSAASLVLSLAIAGCMYFIEIQTNGFHASESSFYFDLGIYGFFAGVFFLLLALVNALFAVLSLLKKEWKLGFVGFLVCIPVYWTGVYANFVYQELRQNPCRWQVPGESGVTCVTKRSKNIELELSEKVS